jgi:hypothetical protein
LKVIQRTNLLYTKLDSEILVSRTEPRTGFPNNLLFGIEIK